MAGTAAGKELPELWELAAVGNANWLVALAERNISQLVYNYVINTFG